MSIAISAEHLAIQASIRKWAAAVDPLATVRASEPGQSSAAAAETATANATRTAKSVETATAAETAATATTARTTETAAAAGTAGTAETTGTATTAETTGTATTAGTAGTAGTADAVTMATARLWADLTDLGVFAILVPEQLGGAGGDALDLAAALEEVAAALVPGPILPTLLAELVLVCKADRPAAQLLLPELAAGRASFAVALDTIGSDNSEREGVGDARAVDNSTPGALVGHHNPGEGRVGDNGVAEVRVGDNGDGAGGVGGNGSLRGGGLGGRWLEGGWLRVSGRAGLVLGAGTATHLLLHADDVWFVLSADQAGVRLTPRTPLDFSRRVADLELTDVLVPADAVLGVGLDDAVRGAAAMLGAVEAAAVAGWCVRTATEYAKVRRQFGHVIGSFQAVKHLCAGMLCRAERATAMAWDAARAVGTGEAPLAAAAAAALALDAAVDNAKDCIQVLGGIGFTWEHDAHLYLRRAVALRQLLGGSPIWRRRSAELTLGGARRSLRFPVEAGLRQGVRARVDGIAAKPEGERRDALAETGYLAPEWPAPYGLDAGPAEQLTIDQELAAAGVSRPDLAIAGWAVPTILRHGTAAQQERFAGPSLRGEITWCQLFSEPGAGSDLASLRTRAERVDGGWRLTGQKVWTSLAGQADWGICLARTDSGAAKHRGLTYFLVAMRDPGIGVRPLREITGRSMFNEVFLDGVFVPDDCVVGRPGDGWRLARGTLEFERIAMGRGSSLGEGVEDLVAALRGTADPVVLDQLGALIADGLAVSLLGVRSVLRRLHGTPAATESAVAKLVGVGQRQAVAEAALTLSGPRGALAGPVTEQFLLTRCLSIAGGTTQILLTLVAERILGLPRER